LIHEISVNAPPFIALFSAKAQTISFEKQPHRLRKLLSLSESSTWINDENPDLVSGSLVQSPESRQEVLNRASQNALGVLRGDFGTIP